MFQVSNGMQMDGVDPCCQDASKAKVEGKSVPPPMAATSSSGKTDTEAQNFGCEMVVV